LTGFHRKLVPGTGARMGALEGLRTPVPVVPAAGEAVGIFMGPPRMT